MTAPGAGTPDGSYTPASVGGMQHMTEASIMAGLRGPIDGAAQGARVSFWDVLGAVATALFGPGAGQPLPRLEDGMTAINQRLDLMEDVSGYGGMIMSRNRNMTGGYKTVPFDTKYGPHTPHSVEVDTANHRFVLAEGTWSVNVLLTVPQHGIFGGVSWHRATITSYYPDGTEHMNQWLDWRSGENPHSFFAQVPLVVPGDGYSVRVRYQANGVQYLLLGGTDRCKFWVNRWDLRTDDNNVIINPGDGPDV